MGIGCRTVGIQLKGLEDECLPGGGLGLGHPLQVARGKGGVAEYLTNSQSARTPGPVLWRKTLSQVPTTFGRLVFLASLRDTSTGRYQHESLIRMLGPEDTDRSLLSSHHQVFSEWLRFSLAEQKADLDEYLASIGGSRRSLQYRNLVPSTAREVERQLYLTDLETLLELMRYE